MSAPAATSKVNFTQIHVKPQSQINNENSDFVFGTFPLGNDDSVEDRPSVAISDEKGSVLIGMHIRDGRAGQDRGSFALLEPRVKKISSKKIKKTLLDTAMHAQATYGEIKGYGAVSCGVAAWLDGNYLYTHTWSLGDAKALLVVIQPNGKRTRIEVLNPKIHNKKISIPGDHLTVNGSYGDIQFENKVTHVPCITQTKQKLNSGCRRFIVIGSDGLLASNYLSEQSIETLISINVKANKSCAEIAQILTAAAVQQFTDNKCSMFDTSRGFGAELRQKIIDEPREYRRDDCTAIVFEITERPKAGHVVDGHGNGMKVGKKAIKYRSAPVADDINNNFIPCFHAKLISQLKPVTEQKVTGLFTITSSTNAESQLVITNQSAERVFPVNYTDSKLLTANIANNSNLYAQQRSSVPFLESGIAKNEASDIPHESDQKLEVKFETKPAKNNCCIL